MGLELKQGENVHSNPSVDTLTPEPFDLRPSFLAETYGPKILYELNVTRSMGQEH